MSIGCAPQSDLHALALVYSIEHFRNLMSMGTVDTTPVPTLKLDLPLSLSSITTPLTMIAAASIL